jgi:hypothetical protein
MQILRPLNPALASPRGLDVLRKYGATLNRGRILKDDTKLWAGAGSRTYSFDKGMLLDDGLAAHAAAGYGQVSGAQAIIDLGGNQAVTYTMPPISNVASLTPQQQRTDAVAVIYVSAATVAATNVYRLCLVGSNSPTLASGNAILGELEIGFGAAMSAPNCGNTPVPLGAGNYPAGEIYELLFTNEQYGTKYEFVSLYVAGVFGSVTLQAFIAVLPRIG